MNRDKIYLVQTDTTVGFLSQKKEVLNIIKGRKKSQKILREVDSLKTLKEFVRVPNKFKKQVRNAKKITFIYKNGESFRVVKDERHLEFLKKFKWMYSTSANITGCKFDEKWAREKASIIVEDKEFFEGEASKIYKISRERMKKIR